MKNREELEKSILSSISGQEMYRHLEWFNGVDRTSGTEGDYRAVDYVVDYLKKHGVHVDVYEFDAYISHPIRASLRLVHPEEREFRCKTRAMSASTVPQGVRAEVVYVPTRHGGVGLLEGVAEDEYSGTDVAGKIVLSERGGPDGIWDAQKHGAIGHIHLWPSDEDVVHEMIASPVWGTPTPETKDRIPTIACVAVKRADGLYLKSLCEKGKVEVILRTETDTRWRKLRLPIATIPGTKEPDKFVLVAGHLDSWYVGITDNATGNACLLELARVFNLHRDSLARSIRIGWWPGHSYGRYAGSTWYADNFFNDIYENCIAYDNIDSPGVKGATDYSSVTAMAEDKAFVEQIVKEITGQKSTGSRPARAGDQSFWGHGVPSLFMLLSNVPKGAAVGGSGGGWWWHSEYDTLDKADIDILVTDTKIHALAVLRLANAEILSFQYKPVADEVIATLAAYEKRAAGRFDFTPAVKAAKEFEARAVEFDAAVAAIPQGSPEKAAIANKTMMKLSRALIPVMYTTTGPFDQDPATPIPSLPGLYRVVELDQHEPESDMYRFLLTRLTRERNRVVRALRDATLLIDEALAALK